MKVFTFFVAAFFFASCSQDPTVAANPPHETLTDHLWICDSVATTESGVRTTDVVGQGMGLDVRFEAATYTVYSSPQIEKYYQLQEDTVFYWSAPNPMDPDSYFLIKDLQNKKLHTWEKDQSSGKTIDIYYHYN